MSDRPSDGMDIDELRDEFDWITEFQSRMAERIRGDADVHNLVDYVDKIDAENAKLRELVRDMHACISHANEQDWFYFERDKFGCGMSCTVNGEACGLCALADRMRELGVEV